MLIAQAEVEYQFYELILINLKTLKDFNGIVSCVGYAVPVEFISF